MGRLLGWRSIFVFSSGPLSPRGRVRGGGQGRGWPLWLDTSHPPWETGPLSASRGPSSSTHKTAQRRPSPSLRTPPPCSPATGVEASLPVGASQPPLARLSRKHLRAPGGPNGKSGGKCPWATGRTHREHCPVLLGRPKSRSAEETRARLRMGPHPPGAAKLCCWPREGLRRPSLLLVQGSLSSILNPLRTGAGPPSSIPPHASQTPGCGSQLGCQSPLSPEFAHSSRGVTHRMPTSPPRGRGWPRRIFLSPPQTGEAGGRE